jgi:hypothetical protein
MRGWQTRDIDLTITLGCSISSRKSPDMNVSLNTNLLAAWESTRLVGVTLDLIGRPGPAEPYIAQLFSVRTDFRRDSHWCQGHDTPETESGKMAIVSTIFKASVGSTCRALTRRLETGVLGALSCCEV